MSAQGQSGDLAPSPAERLFIEVEGVRLHYSDRGSGRPVVLIHSNIVTGDDYNTSGVAERLLGTRRVIIFDRPGYGYSERPRWRPWTAIAQAELLHKALRELGVRWWPSHSRSGTSPIRPVLCCYLGTTFRPFAWMH